MRRSTLSAAPVLLALLLAPPAAGAPLGGHLHDAVDLHWRGAVSLSSPDGTLDLAAAVAAGENVSLEFAGGEVRRTVYREEGVEPLFVSFEVQEDPPRRLGAGSLVRVACEPDCKVLVFPLDSDSEVALGGRADGFLPWIPEPVVYCGRACPMEGPASEGEFKREVPPGAFRAAGVAGVGSGGLSGGRATGEGRLGLFVRNATVEVWADGRTLVVETTHERHRAGPLGPAGAFEGQTPHAVLLLEGARLRTGSPTAAVLLAPTAEIEVDGTLASTSASGALRLGDQPVRFERERVEVSGAVGLGATALPGALPSARGSAKGSVWGDASLVRVDGRAFAAPAPQGAPAAQAGLLALLVALLLVILGRLALAPFYSRITRQRVLDNPNRQRLHALLRERPGRTLAELTRILGVSRVVAHHHLRVLEAHGLVAGRGGRRGRSYHLTGERGGEEATTARMALRVEARARLARVLLEAGGLTQQDLAARAGLSQRLVSYHLNHLEAWALVAKDGARPSRYAPTPALREALEGADATP